MTEDRIEALKMAMGFRRKKKPSEETPESMGAESRPAPDPEIENLKKTKTREEELDQRNLEDEYLDKKYPMSEAESDPEKVAEEEEDRPRGLFGGKDRNGKPMGLNIMIMMGKHKRG